MAVVQEMRAAWLISNPNDPVAVPVATPVVNQVAIPVVMANTVSVEQIPFERVNNTNGQTSTSNVISDTVIATVPSLDFVDLPPLSTNQVVSTVPADQHYDQQSSDSEVEFFLNNINTWIDLEQNFFQ